MQAKLIVIEGTDCSGKETQSLKLRDRLNEEGIKTNRYYYPFYESPTGKIIGGPYLGKPHIMEGFFPEGAANVDSKIAALYYAADRKYNENKIENDLQNNVNVILDRYTYSNMGHQGGKETNQEKRLDTYKWLEKLEFDFLNLRKPDIKILLYMPSEYAIKLRTDRLELPDQHEIDENHQKNAERAYLEIADLYNFKVINCVDNNRIKTKDEISNEVYNYVIQELK